MKKETLKKILKKNGFKPIELMVGGIILRQDNKIKKIRYTRYIFRCVEYFLAKRLKLGNAIEIYSIKDDEKYKENTII